MTERPIEPIIELETFRRVLEARKVGATLCQSLRYDVDATAVVEELVHRLTGYDALRESGMGEL